MAESTNLTGPMSKYRAKCPLIIVQFEHTNVEIFFKKKRCKNLGPLDETRRNILSVSSLFWSKIVSSGEIHNHKWTPTLHPHHHKSQTNFGSRSCQSDERTLDTLPKTNIAPTNGWLEYYFPIGKAYFQGLR